MRTVRDIPVLHNTPVLVRSALNLPVAQGRVTNTFRLRRSLPTIAYLQKEGARVILIGHLGEQGTETFAPVFDALKKFIPEVRFCPVATGPVARQAVRELRAGEVLLLENLRRNPGETKNDGEFARELAMLADVFVQDSFDVCHRQHASVVGVPAYLPSYAGLLVEQEVQELTKALKPARPSIAIIGGAKFATKQPVLKKLIGIYDHVFVGGALANDFLKALGKPLGKSLVSGVDNRELEPLLADKKLLLPVDSIVSTPEATGGIGRVSDLETLGSGESIRDDGPETLALIAAHVQQAKTVLWNGPLGYYENGFTKGTEGLARIIAASDAYSVIGGGDTIAAIEHLSLEERFSFLSTGGGAMLDFLAKGTLPGLDALSKHLTK